jgi:DNA polymerase-4
MELYRAILHVDMNNFYASVECMRHPEWVGKPVAVCGETEERHGIVLAKNYAAKAYGIITGEPVIHAKQKCPELIIAEPHYDEYVRISDQARKIYGQFTDRIEPLGLDECWLDVTGSRRIFGTGRTIAHRIRRTVRQELGVTVSVGVSFNKVFAKLGSDMRKPDSVTVIPPESFREVVWCLPVSDLLGVGRATAKKLYPLGIYTIGDLARYPYACLESKLGKCGGDLWRFANGLDNSRVVTRSMSDLDKTVGHGITTLRDLVEPEEVWLVMLELSQNVGHRLHLFDRRATGVAISVRDNALVTKQWQCGLVYPTQSAHTLAEAAFDLFQRSYAWQRPIRSVTVRAIGLIDGNTDIQISMFSNADTLVKRETIDSAVEALRSRYGNHIIRNAVLLTDNKMPHEDVLKRAILQKEGV